MKGDMKDFIAVVKEYLSVFFVNFFSKILL